VGNTSVTREPPRSINRPSTRRHSIILARLHASTSSHSIEKNQSTNNDKLHTVNHRLHSILTTMDRPRKPNIHHTTMLTTSTTNIPWNRSLPTNRSLLHMAIQQRHGYSSKPKTSSNLSLHINHNIHHTITNTTKKKPRRTPRRNKTLNTEKTTNKPGNP